MGCVFASAVFYIAPENPAAYVTNKILGHPSEKVRGEPRQGFRVPAGAWDTHLKKWPHIDATHTSTELCPIHNKYKMVQYLIIKGYRVNNEIMICTIFCDSHKIYKYKSIRRPFA